MTAAIITIGNIYGQVPDGPARFYAQRLLRYKRRGVEYTNAYKQGWDGYIKLVSRDGLFPAGLGPYLQDKLQERGIAAELRWQDSRPLPSPVLERVSMGAALMDHQDEAAAEAYRMGRGIIHHPTGAGKTVLGIEIIRQCAVPTLVLAHRKELVYQFAEELRAKTDVPGLVGIIGDGHWDPNWITVSTFQSLVNAIASPTPEVNALVERWQLVMVDELHHLTAPTFEAVMKRLYNCWYRFGLSGTPFKTAGDDEAFFKATGWLGPVISRKTAQEGIDFGRLVPANIVLVDPGPPLPDDRTYPAAVESGIVWHTGRNRLASGFATTLSADGPVLVLCERIDHGHTLLNMIRQRGIQAEFISGKDSTQVRQGALKAFRDGRLPVLVSSVILDEGVDVPNISALVLTGGGMAQHRVIQRVGRGQRRSEGKDSVMVIDFKDHGKYLRKHSDKRARLYYEEPAYAVSEISFDEAKGMIV